MNERVLPVARVAIRCLYPEPGTTSVEYELVRLVATAEVDGRENLDVEEVGEILLEEAWTCSC